MSGKVLNIRTLELLGNEVCNLSPNDRFPHLYLFANPGIGAMAWSAVKKRV